MIHRTHYSTAVQRCLEPKTSVHTCDVGLFYNLGHACYLINAPLLSAGSILHCNVFLFKCTANRRVYSRVPSKVSRSSDLLLGQSVSFGNLQHILFFFLQTISTGVCFPELFLFTAWYFPPLRLMDLLGAESRKTGTRGGRADFTWDAVKDDERQYYLGNSVAKPHTSRRNASQPEFGWYAKPILSSAPAPHTTTASASASTSVPLDPPSSQGFATADDLKLVRRREKAIMERMIISNSFSDAVRSALTESIGSGVDDEGSSHDAAATAARLAVRRREKTEKAQRKEVRRRVREQRRIRRAEKYGRRDKHHQSQSHVYDTSESERESVRSRFQEDHCKRRRRRERDCAPRRKRPEWSSSENDDPDCHRIRRQRLR